MTTKEEYHEITNSDFTDLRGRWEKNVTVNSNNRIGSAFQIIADVSG